MKQFYDLMKKCPLLAGIISIAFGVAFVLTVGSGEEFCVEALLIRIGLTFVCIAFLFMISGDKVLVNSNNQTGLAFRKFIPLLIFSFLYGLSVFLSNIKDHQFVPNLPLFLILGLVQVIFIGLYEELSFRAIFNDAILYQFRDKKGVFVAIAIFSCFVFGVVHVIGADCSTLLGFSQAVMKTVTTALFGFLMLVVYWKTHNILVCGIVHGLYDFGAAFVNYMFVAEHADGYVLSGTMELEGITVDMGLLALGMYGFQLIVMIVLEIIMLPTLKSIDFKKIREEW